MSQSNKRKIFNDPVYGFVTLPNELIFKLIEHPWFQRLRRIQQLGLTQLVYPGAIHTRFSHAIGAMHLMQLAISTLKQKGIEISAEEEQGAYAAILLHDIGHGPFSHTLEHSIVLDVQHEALSELCMIELNKELNGQLDIAIAIFRNDYPRKFFHQLVSGQLDVDRMDYLSRDSFFTGVSEGVINFDRIIKMLDVYDDQLVVEQKAIYSLEKFLIARRLMYWQVYFHKTVIAAETMLQAVLERARLIYQKGEDIYLTPSLKLFMERDVSMSEMKEDLKLLEHYFKLDDHEFIVCMKSWMDSKDKTLAELSRRIVNRNLFGILLQSEPFAESKIQAIKQNVMKQLDIDEEAASFFVRTGQTINSAYTPEEGSIKILFKNGELVDIAEASDQLNISVLSEPVVKYYLYYPKEYAN